MLGLIASNVVDVRKFSMMEITNKKHTFLLLNSNLTLKHAMIIKFELLINTCEINNSRVFVLCFLFRLIKCVI